MDYILEEMNKYDADGIDFMPITEHLIEKDYFRCKVVVSYTKEEWISGDKCIPKTAWRLYKIVDGKKKYIEKKDI